MLVRLPDLFSYRSEKHRGGENENTDRTACFTGLRSQAGTSFGISTIYLSLAVQATIKLRGGEGRVVATELEPEKAARARSIWSDAPGEIGKYIDLREGDLRETLKQDLQDIDLLLLDSKLSLTHGYWSVLRAQSGPH